MRFLSFVFISVLLALTVALPQHGKPLGIPIHKRSTLARNGIVNFDAIRSHLAHSEQKYLSGIAAFERQTGVPSSSSSDHALAQRAAGSVPLTNNDNANWHGTISVGTPPVEYTVDFDTGSADLFLPAADCKSSCDGHTRYDPGASSSAVNVGQQFSISYGDGSVVSGKQYADTVTIAGLEVKNQCFGAASEYSTAFESPGFVPDGLIGMAFPNVSQLQGNPIMQTLIQEKQISDPVFAFKLASEGSELVIGGVDASSYKGSFTYTPVTTQGFWQINLDSVNADGKAIFKDVSAVVDTGTTFILSNVATVRQFYGALNATDVGGGFYAMPCDAMPSVSITIGGKPITISAETFNLGAYDDSATSCIGAIVAGDALGSTWTLGDVFLRNVYTVFDVGGLRVGFADLA